MPAVFFDLDNTLYDVEQYFSGAFHDVAEYLSRKYQMSETDIHDELMDLWKTKTSMYPHIFDVLLDNIGVDGELEGVVGLFNSYDFKIKPYPDVIPALEELKREKHVMGLITDGNTDRQKRKIRSSGLIDFFDVVIYTKEIGNPKPSEIPFIKAMSAVSADPQDSHYIGDNPIIDFIGAKIAGMKTVRIIRGEFRHCPTNEYIDYEIETLEGWKP